MKKKIKTNFYPLALIAIGLFICLLNYTPETFLTGWDTLHPEFDFPLNFKRLIFGVWRQEQGLGAVAGHSHMADLPRVFILWLFHFFLPLNTLRYAYVFSCLILGPLGIYYLISFLFRRRTPLLIAFLGALFYLFNPSTVQQFYVPFEMFPTQYAFLPWIILFALKFLKRSSRKNLLIFAIFSLFSTSQAYAAHLWYPFFIIFCSFLALNWFLNRPKIKLKPNIILISITLLVNSYWLLPNLYYIATSSEAPRLHKSNRLHSQEFRLRNQETGYLKDVALNRGFYFNWEIFNFNKWKPETLMPEWNSHLQNHDVLLIGYLIFFLALSNLIIAFVRKEKKLIPFSVFFILPFIFLGNRIIFLDKIFDWLSQIPILNEGLRFVFTKFSILFQFSITIFFAYCLFNLFRWLKKPFWFHKAAIFLSFAFVVYGYPMLDGKLISSKVKIKIPNYYFQFWQFMKEQPDGRVLSLPLHQTSGWQYYDWGYQGAGFIWFGLKQPILDRDFDRWETKNEESFREAFCSIYSNNPYNFAKILKKYNINYIVWDQALTSTALKNVNQITFKFEINRLISQLENKGIVEKLAHFDQISVYKINTAINPIASLQHIDVSVSPNYLWGYTDAAYESRGDYFSYLAKEHADFYYPFRDILNKYSKIDVQKLNIAKKNNLWQVDLKKIPEYSQIFFPEPNEAEKELSQQISITNENRVSFSAVSYLELSAEEIFNLNPDSPGISLDQNAQPLILYTSLDSTTGSNILLENAPHSIGYIIGFKSKNINSLPLRFCLKNLYTNLCSLEEELSRNKSLGWDYFLIPPTDEAYGYNLILSNISYGHIKTVNQLMETVIIPIPYRFLSHIYLSDKKEITFEPKANRSQANSLFPGFVKLKVEKDTNLLKRFAVLNQSFNGGWLAFYFDGLKPVFLKDHVLVNNWANGWRLASTESAATSYYILFWPQILEFLGFGLLGITLVKVIKSKKQLNF